MPRARRGEKNHLGIKRRLRSELPSPERLLWSKFRGKQFHALKFRRQHGIGPYIVDFYCPDKALVIEVDGETHAANVQIEKDNERTAYLHSLGLTVLRYTNHEVHSNLEGVLEDLRAKLQSGGNL